MKNSIIAAVCALSVLATACSTPQGPNQQNDMLIGGGLGAVGGGLLGAAVGGPRGALLGVGLGALAGGAIGSSVGADTDRRQIDRNRANARYNQAAYDDRDPYRY